MKFLRTEEERVEEYTNQVQEITEWIKDYRKTLWEIEEYRPKLLKEGVQWALDFEVRNRLLEFSSYDNPIIGTLLPEEKEVNKDITKEANKFMEHLKNKTLAKGTLTLDFRKVQLATSIVGKGVSHPAYENIDLMAIVVKAILLAKRFYQRLMELENEPRSRPEKTQLLFQMIEDFRIEHIIPASMIVAFELIGEKAFDPYKYIIQMCSSDEVQEIRKCYKLMKMTLGLSSNEVDPISQIANYPKVQAEVKVKAIAILNSILEDGGITNPSVSSRCMARMAIEKAIKDRENMEDTQRSSHNFGMDKQITSQKTSCSQQSNGNATVLNYNSTNGNSNTVQLNKDQLNMNDSHHSNGFPNEEIDDMSDDHELIHSPHLEATDSTGENTKKVVNPLQANKALLNKVKIPKNALIPEKLPNNETANQTLNNRNENRSITENISYNPKKRTYLCTRCDYYEDPALGKVKRHLNTCTKDTKIYKYKCEKCRKRFVKKYSLLQHSPKCQPKIANYNRQDIEASMEFVVNTKKYRCKNCAYYDFNRRWPVERHVRSCLMNRPFKCNHCMLGLSTEKDLKQHMERFCKMNGNQ